MGKKHKRKSKERRKVKYLRDAEGKFQGSVTVATIPSPMEIPQAVSRAETNPSSTPDLAKVYSALRSVEDARMLNQPAEAAYVQNITQKVAIDLGISKESVSNAFESWCSAGYAEFEDKAASNVDFRYDLHPDAPSDPKSSRALRKLGYEHFLKQLHPVFVYGTLRRGQGNSGLMDRARLSTVPARMNSVSLYTKHWGFPYAKEDTNSDSSIVGEIVWLDDSSEGDEARASLDYLEGFNSDFPSHSHYERVEREIEYIDIDGVTRKTKVWVYFARGSAAESLEPNDKIESGDWVEASRARRR